MTAARRLTPPARTALHQRSAPGPVLPADGWQDDAACLGLDVDLFYTPAAEDAAREICHSCPVRIPCDTTARIRREYGVWGGRTRDQRQAAAKTNAARPALAARRAQHADGRRQPPTSCTSTPTCARDRACYLRMRKALDALPVGDPAAEQLRARHTACRRANALYQQSRRRSTVTA